MCRKAVVNSTAKRAEVRLESRVRRLFLNLYTVRCLSILYDHNWINLNMMAT